MPTPRIRTIALVAHDNCKETLVGWVREHARLLMPHRLVCTGTTGRLVRDALLELTPKDAAEPEIRLLKSGPLGGDQQMGALIADGKVDMLIFFWEYAKVK